METQSDAAFISWEATASLIDEDVRRTFGEDFLDTSCSISKESKASIAQCLTMLCRTQQ